MKNLPVLLLALALLFRPALAQTLPYFFDGVWNCRYPGETKETVHCTVECGSTTPPAIKEYQYIMGCAANRGPDYHAPSVTHPDECPAHFAKRTGFVASKLCCVGYPSLTDCLRAAGRISAPEPPAPEPPPVPDPPPSEPDPQPDPVSDPAPEPPRPAASSNSSGGGGAGGMVALGGLFLGYYFVTNWITDAEEAEMFPEGFHLSPQAQIWHRDGRSGARAGMTAQYGDWTARAFSRHTVSGWENPDASLEWAVRFSSWELRARASHPGESSARIEWAWRF